MIMAVIPFGRRSPGQRCGLRRRLRERSARAGNSGQPGEPGAVDRLVDRLVRDMLRRVTGELAVQRLADLLRAPPLLQPLPHELPQRLIAGDLARPRPGPPLSRQLVRGERAVLPAARIPVSAKLPAGRRRAAVQPFRDRPYPGPGPAQIRDLDPPVLRQIPRRDLPLTAPVVIAGA
jgi:hypothetical protein